LHFRIAAIFWHYGIGRQGTAAELREVDLENSVFADPNRGSDTPSGIQFEPMSLSVVKRKSEQVIAVSARNGGRGGRIEAAGE
jgi:hypothetical protein